MSAVYALFTMLMAMWGLILVIAILAIVAMWRIFVKAGEPGWACLIPFYNSYTLYKISWGNGWYFLLLLIPMVNVIITIITQIKLAEAFGKSGGFAVGLIFLNSIFMLILGFDSSEYVGIPGQNYDRGYYNGQGYGTGYNGGQNYYRPNANPYSQSQAGYQNQSFQQQGYPPQGNPQQGYPQQGYQPQGYAPQGYPPQEYQPQGYPQQPAQYDYSQQPGQFNYPQQNALPGQSDGWEWSQDNYQ